MQVFFQKICITPLKFHILPLSEKVFMRLQLLSDTPFGVSIRRFLLATVGKLPCL